MFSYNTVVVFLLTKLHLKPRKLKPAVNSQLRRKSSSCAVTEANQDVRNF